MLYSNLDTQLLPVWRHICGMVPQITCFVLSRQWAICLTYLADVQYLKGTVARTAKALTISNQMEREIMAFRDPVPDIVMACCPHEFMRAVMTLWIKVVGR